MILGAGRGTRLGALGERIPKILLEIGGEPLLARHLRRIESTEIRHVVVNAHHLANQVLAFARRYSGPLELTVLVEPLLLGTAGAVRNALPYLGAGPFVVIYGDVLLDELFEPLVEVHKRAGASATLAVYHAPSTTGKGVVHLDDEGRVVAFAEKRQDGPGVVNAGVYVLERDLVEQIPPDVPLDFGRDVIPAALAAGRKIVAHHLARPVLDIGTPAALALARAGCADDQRMRERA